MGYINYWLREPPEDEGIALDPDGRIPPFEEEDYEFYADDDIAYKFNENELIRELQDYIDSTYSAHYSRNKFQSTEFIIDCGHGQGFALGNVLKYVQRYGKKDGYNRADLMKVLHYALIALYNHDHEESNNEI
jgi:hypothetical protein